MILGEGEHGQRDRAGGKQGKNVVSWRRAPGWRHREAWEWSLRSEFALAGGRGCDL